MRKITIEIEDKTFERLKKIKRASVIKQKRSASLPVDKSILFGELGRR